ncbi:MAG: hypothetical protein B6D37_11245 [Sphingobacteriales bacterium UTBCD1]|jgi:hypothetical protein|nr:MAG: hypothetical protein B6D37_11245 [Sphingobacteriales bacterium UTBCD1]
MRKLILTLLLLPLTASLFSQSIDDVKKFAILQKWDEAKTNVDKFLSVEKNQKNAEGWYYKGYIYSELSKLPNYAGTDVRMQAFDAFKKYQELDPKNALMKEGENVEYFVIYNGYFDDAVARYNEKKYGDAFNDFKNALTVEEFIRSKNYSYKGFSFPALDTQLIQNVALAALQNKDSANAVTYYQKLADAKVKSENFLDTYRFLIDYYNTKNDSANRDKYLAISKELYPAEPYWEDYEWKFAGKDPQKKEEVLAKYPASYTLYYNYAAELFNELYAAEKQPADYAAREAKLESMTQKAIDIDKSRPEGNLLMARILNNKVFDLSDAYSAIKGNKPDDVKKKNDLMAQINSTYDKLLTYATTVYNIYDGKQSLKPFEKGNFKMAANLILGYWEYKKDAAKIKQYQDKMKSLD